MIYLIAIVIALVVGSLFGIQSSINGLLGHAVEHPLQASLISFASGTLTVAVCCIAMGDFPPRFVTAPSELPLWIWTGGLIGAVVVTASLVMVPRIGSLLWFGSLVTGQILTATVLDHFGWLGNPRVTASPLRLLGAGLLLAGLMVIVGAKSLERRSPSAETDDLPAQQSPRID